MSNIINRYQKLASAIYLITGFFADQEPLKWRLRALSTDLVSQNVKDKLSLTHEILNLFSVAKNAGLISEPNYEILVREFSKLEKEVEKPLELMFSGESAFSIAPAKSQDVLETSRTPEPQVASAEPVRHQTMKDRISLPPVDRKLEERPNLKEFGAVSVKKSSRQSVIISLLKRKKEIMIKDVSPLISGCSEKTIQRELGEMVASGILTRVGEKRWTRYSLA